MKYYFPILLGMIIMNSCSNKFSIAEKNINDEVLESSNNTNYRLGKNFIIKNDYNAAILNKSYIDNHNQFKHVFSLINSKINEKEEIDFDEEFIIPIILERTSIGTKISIDEIHVIDNEILINYTVNQLDELSYMTQPYEVIILKKNIVKDLNKLKLKFNRTTNLL